MLRTSALIVALAAAAAAPLRAQADGFWYGASVGRGITRFACDICNSSRGAGMAGTLRMGGVVSWRVLVGAEATGWRRTEGVVDQTTWGLSAVAYVYPLRTRSLYWKAGAGMLSYRSEDTQDAITSTALGVHIGLGYDLPLSSRLYLTPHASAFIASLGGEVKFNGAEIMDQANLSLFQVGIGIGRR